MKNENFPLFSNGFIVLITDTSTAKYNHPHLKFITTIYICVCVCIDEYIEYKDSVSAKSTLFFKLFILQIHIDGPIAATDRIMCVLAFWDYQISGVLNPQDISLSLLQQMKLHPFPMIPIHLEQKPESLPST